MPVLEPRAFAHLIAPASPPREDTDYPAVLMAIQRDWSIRTAYAPGAPRGYLAAPDAERTSALERALTDPEAQAVLCVRGGYGCLRLLPHLNWNALQRATPRWIVGYSDITALQMACWHKLGWPSITGPVATEWPKLPRAMRNAVFRSTQPTPWTPPLPPNTNAPVSLTHGTATGPLLGGTLSVLTRLLGTPYMPDLTGAILLLEDVQEPPYAVDRMLMHMELAGVLDRLGGAVLGQFRLPASVSEPTLSMDTVLADYFADRPYPVLMNVAYGHCLPRLCLPMGVPFRLHLTPKTTSMTCYPVQESQY